MIFALETTKIAQKYVKILSDCQLSSEESLNNFAYVAGQTRKKIGEAFDFFDADKSKTPYLRHSFHRVTEIVRNAYDFELTYQTGLNLIERLRSLKFLDKDDIFNYKKKIPLSSKILKFFKRSRSNMSILFEKPETIIENNEEFWSNLKEIYNRIPEKNIYSL